MPVLFESCWDGAPVAGPQLPPRPGVHNSRWVQSPGMAALADPAAGPRLEAYVTGVVAAFARDPRILAWDVWNEPDNGPEVNLRDHAMLAAKADLVLPLLDAAFDWVRAARSDAAADQRDLVGRLVEPRDAIADPAMPARPVRHLSASTTTTSPTISPAAVGWLAALGRPVLCTEYMARPRGSTFAAIVPVAAAARVGLFNWGLVRGTHADAPAVGFVGPPLSRPTRPSRGSTTSATPTGRRTTRPRPRCSARAAPAEPCLPRGATRGKVA